MSISCYFWRSSRSNLGKMLYGFRCGSCRLSSPGVSYVQDVAGALSCARGDVAAICVDGSLYHRHGQRWQCLGREIDPRCWPAPGQHAGTPCRLPSGPCQGCARNSRAATVSAAMPVRKVGRGSGAKKGECGLGRWDSFSSTVSPRVCAQVSGLVAPMPQ